MLGRWHGANAWKAQQTRVRVYRYWDGKDARRRGTAIARIGGEVMSSRSAIDDDRVRVALGRSVAVLQHLMRWGAEALRGLDQHSDNLADLARALLRNHVTGPQVQRMITLLDCGTLGADGDEGLMATRHQLLRLVFEGVNGKAYGDYPWRDAMEAGALPFDNGLDPIKLASRLQRLGLHHAWENGRSEVSQGLADGLQGVAVGRVKKHNYPEHGAPIGGFEKILDGISGQRVSFSLAVAMLMLAPQMIGYGETLVFSGTTISTDPQDGNVDHEWFPAITRTNAPGAQFVGLVKARLDWLAGDNHWFSVRITRK